MPGIETVQRVRESSGPGEAFQLIVDALASGYRLRAARWRAYGRAGYWPTREQAEALLGAPPAGGHLLVMPIEPGRGELRFLLPAGSPPVSWEELERLAGAFSAVVEREGQGGDPGDDREELRRRVEESEALHVLGLAANRTLDPDEVVALVARSIRTVLGAHYVTVATREAGGLTTVAAEGLRADGSGADPLAALVVAARKPLIVGDGEPLKTAEFPLHQEEGMRSGLGVPLSAFGETFGAVVIGYRREHLLTPRDVRLALTLAGHAAVAISNARLHRALADRSRELERTNEELVWMAEAKERFFAALSHELRTPLHSVIGYQSLLLDAVVGELPEKAREFLESAHRATQSLLILIDDFLDLTRLDANKLELHPRPFDLRAVIAEAVETVRPLAERNGLELRTELRGQLENVVSDPDRVRQIIVNLLSNGVKFTDGGHVTVETETRVEASAPRWIVLRVRDSGPGIPYDDRERIFQEFEQIAAPTRSGGAGLGLPISRRLARLLGGDLWLEATDLPGASFILRLPAELPAGGAGFAKPGT